MVAKKKNNSKFFFILIILILLFILFKDKISLGGNSDACGKREADPDRSGYCLVSSSDYDGLIIITGNTQNSPEPNLDFSDGDLNDILSGVFYSDGQISIVSAAGQNLEISIKRNFTPKKNLNSSRNNLKKLAEQLNSSIKESPSEAGADYFGAILKAQNIIKTKRYKNPLILVVGSGYSDRGVLDFAHDDILGRYTQDENIESLIASDKSVVSDSLNGVTVKWYNAAVVSDPQKDIDDHNQAITRSLYKSLFEYLGANAEIYGDTGLKSYKSVDSKYTVGQVYVQKLQKGDSFSVNEDVGRFRVDSNELINRDEVKDKLRNFASQFDNSGNLRLKLTGYIAICAPGSNLGELRAETIKQVLAELGVSADKIDVFGQPGAPSGDPNEDYTCNSDLPETERRTVIIEVTGN